MTDQPTPPDCPDCDGTGRIECATPWCSDDGHDSECSTCRGTGEQQQPTDHDHARGLVHHRDGRAPWCNVCRRDAHGTLVEQMPQFGQTPAAPPEGFCVCDDGPARDCGISAHRRAAGVEQAKAAHPAFAAPKISDAEHGEQVRDRLAAWIAAGDISVGRVFWKRVPEQFWLCVDDGAGTLAYLDDSDETEAQTTRARAELIAHAPDDLARLLARAEAAEAKLAQAQEWADGIYEDSNYRDRSYARTLTKIIRGNA